MTMRTPRRPLKGACYAIVLLIAATSLTAASAQEIVVDTTVVNQRLTVTAWDVDEGYQLEAMWATSTGDYTQNLGIVHSLDMLSQVEQSLIVGDEEAATQWLLGRIHLDDGETLWGYDQRLHWVGSELREIEWVNWETLSDWDAVPFAVSVATERSAPHLFSLILGSASQSDLCGLRQLGSRPLFGDPG